jgi:hypothetical protein
MRTAICLHGLSLGRNTLRDITRSNPDNDWKRFNKTILSNLIENNKSDVFIHTWEHDEINQIIDKTHSICLIKCIRLSNEYPGK